MIFFLDTPALRGTVAAESKGIVIVKHKLAIGAHVVYITPDREYVNALVEVIHSGSLTPEEHLDKYGNLPCINVLYFSPDPNKTDQHGRQKERATSVCHGKLQGEPQGYCWLWPDEVNVS